MIYLCTQKEKCTNLVVSSQYPRNTQMASGRHFSLQCPTQSSYHQEGPDIQLKHSPLQFGCDSLPVNELKNRQCVSFPPANIK